MGPYPWWLHHMETFFTLLALCAGNSPISGELPSQRPMTRSFDFSLIFVWTNGWVNNRDAVDLIHHSAHCDVTVMPLSKSRQIMLASKCLQSQCVDMEIDPIGRDWPKQRFQLQGFAYDLLLPLEINKINCDAYLGTKILRGMCWIVIWNMELWDDWAMQIIYKKSLAYWLKWNGRPRTNDIFAFILLIKNCYIRIQISLKNFPKGPIKIMPNHGSYNLASKRRQTIIWTNDGVVHWRIFASSGIKIYYIMVRPIIRVTLTIRLTVFLCVCVCFFVSFRGWTLNTSVG